MSTPNLGFGRKGTTRAVLVNPAATINPGDFAEYDATNHRWDIAATIADSTKFGGLYIDQQPLQSNPFPSGSGIATAPALPAKIQDHGIWSPGIVLKSGDVVEDGSPLAINTAGYASVQLNAGADTLTIGYANVPGGGQITGDGKLKIEVRIRCNYPSSFLAQ